jgi:hypothetical protein
VRDPYWLEIDAVEVRDSEGASNPSDELIGLYLAELTSAA